MHTLSQWNSGFGNTNCRNQTFPNNAIVSFQWDNNHNVIKMASRTHFETCNFTGGTNLGATSPVNVTLASNTAADGIAYFACSVEPHCSNGQKLAATLVAGGTPSTSPLLEPCSVSLPQSFAPVGINVAC